MIVVVGESLIDIVQTGGAPDESVGGGPLNIAVGLARLDQPSLLITQTGNDDRSERVMAHLRDNQVEVVSAPTQSGRTNTATASLDDHGVASYEFDIEWTLPHQDLPRCDVLHVGSLGTTLEPGRDSVVDLVDQAWARDVFVSFDPNLRPQFLENLDLAWRDLESIADRCALVKLSSEDIESVHAGADLGDIARSLLTGERTELVVVTDGENGSHGFTDTLQVTVPTPPVELVDTVGAGDSFMSAMLTILMDAGAMSAHGPGMPADDEALARVLRGAADAAAITCSRRGANPPTRRELPEDWPS